LKGWLSTLVVAGEFWEAKESYLARIELLGITGQVRLEDRYIRMKNWSCSLQPRMSPLPLMLAAPRAA
jgi:hypothetical protein